MLNEYVSCDADFDVLTEKGVYPYTYISEMEKFDESALHPQSAFDNNLSEEKCSDEL